MYHPVLVTSNNGNGSQRSHNQICTKQAPATTRQKEATHITQESDPSSSINTGEMVSSNAILQAALKRSTILKYKTHQSKWNNYYIQNNMSHIQPKIGEFLDYFTHLYNSGASNSIRNSVKVPSLKNELFASH